MTKGIIRGSSNILSLKQRTFFIPIFNRATYGRMKVLIEKLSGFPNVRVVVVLSSSLLWEEFGKASDYITKSHEKVTFHSLDIPNYPQDAAGSSRVAGEILIKFSEFLSKVNEISELDRISEKVVIVTADRYETLPAAQAALQNDMPIIHFQGGECTSNWDERIRHAVTKLADYHFVSTKLARKYIEAMGEETSRIFNLGCPSLDLITKHKIHRVRGKDRYLLVIFHPETGDQTDRITQTKEVFGAVFSYCASEGITAIWYYPNSDPGNSEIKSFLDQEIKKQSAFIVKAINKPPEKFLAQLACAYMIVGNSSCGIRESSFLGVPSVNVGLRQGIRERGLNVIDCDPDKQSVLNAMYSHQSASNRGFTYYNRSHIYGHGRSSGPIAEKLSRMEITKKGTLTYPFETKFMEEHFGTKRDKWTSTYTIDRKADPELKALRSEHGAPWERNGKADKPSTSYACSDREGTSDSGVKEPSIFSDNRVFDEESS